jgi:beta-barrel assembly-enhancing protease
MDTGTFNDGSSAKSFNCNISFSGELINIFLTDELQQQIIWNVLHLKSCHLNGHSLIVKYGEYPSQTLECTGEIATQIYHSWSAGKVIRHAEGYLFSRKNFMVIVLCVFFLLLTLGIYFYALPWIGEKAASLIPIDTEIELGKSISGTIEANEDAGNAKADVLANQFADELVLSTDYPIRLHVLTSEQINAFALPGGNIFIYSGILKKMNSYEQLVALIGHEVTHVADQHALKSMCRSAASGFFVAALFGDISGISAGILKQADEFKQLQYSRELEVKADLAGLELMINNKVDPRGMISLLELLDTESVEMPQLMQYLSTHPETKARIDNIRDRVNEAGHFPLNEKRKQLFDELKASL